MQRTCATPAGAAEGAAWAGVVAPFAGPVPDVAAAAAAAPSAAAEALGLYVQAAGDRGERCPAIVSSTSPGVRGLGETAPEGAGATRPGERGVSPETLPKAAGVPGEWREPGPPALGALPTMVACGAGRRALLGVDQRSPGLGVRTGAAATATAAAAGAVAGTGSDSTEREELSRGNGCAAPGDSGFSETGGLGVGAAPLDGDWGMAVGISWVWEADEVDVIIRSMLSIILRFFSASK